MKKSFLAFTLAAALFSCKKDKTNDFTATDVTGTTIVKGNISKNVITPNGSGGWTNSSSAKIPASGVNISITINKNSLYPNSTAQGADVYTGVTDTNGNFNITVKSNATGVLARLTIDGYTGTLDTLINGVTHTGLITAFQGTTMTTTLYMGQNAQINYVLNSALVMTNPNTIQTGTAIVTGSVSMNLPKQGGGFADVAVPQGHKVYLRLSNDPATLGPKTYETSTDASGYYTFNLTTVAIGTSGFPQSVQVWINDFATTRDTIKTDLTRIPGKSGVFQQSSTALSGVYNNSIKNAVYLRYSFFVPN